MRIKKPKKEKKVRLSVSISPSLNDEYDKCLRKIGAKKSPHAATLIEDYVAAQRRAS